MTLIFMTLCGLFLIAGIAIAVLEKIGDRGPEMAKILSMVVFVAGIGIVVGMLAQTVNQVNTVFRVF